MDKYAVFSSLHLIYILHLIVISNFQGKIINLWLL